MENPLAGFLLFYTPLSLDPRNGYAVWGRMLTSKVYWRVKAWYIDQSRHRLVHLFNGEVRTVMVHKHTPLMVKKYIGKSKKGVV